MVGERHLLYLLASAEGAVDTKCIDLVEDLHGEEPERAAVDTGLGSAEASEGVVCLAAVGGPAVVHHPPAHGPGKRVPGLRRREVSRGHDGLVLPQLVSEVGDAVFSEGREEERVRVLGREREKSLGGFSGEARGYEVDEAFGVRGERGGGDVEREGLVSDGRVLGEAADEGHHVVPGGLGEARRARRRLGGGELVP